MYTPQAETAETHLVAHVRGEVREVFEQVDKDNSGSLGEQNRTAKQSSPLRAPWYSVPG